MKLKFLFSMLLLYWATLVLKAQAPILSGFTPLKAKPGTTIVISGNNFNPTQANNVVFFGAVKATLTAATTTSLQVTVPSGASFETISVFNSSNKLMGSSALKFIPVFDGEKILTNGSFAKVVSFAAGDGNNESVTADLNNDGKPEIITISRDANDKVDIYENMSSPETIGGSSFGSRVILNASYYSNNIAIGDLDGDGLQDLVVGSDDTFGGAYIEIFQNIYSGGPISVASFAAPVYLNGQSGNNFDIALADFDLDGKLDIAGMTDGTGNIYVYKNIYTSGLISAGSFASQVVLGSGPNAPKLLATDLNNDGQSELISGSNGIVTVLRNVATGKTITGSSFSAPVNFTVSGAITDMASADLDGDGKQEIITTQRGTNNLSILKNLINGPGISSASLAQPFSLNAVGVNTISVNDYDGDGASDIAVTYGAGYGNSFSIYKNTYTSGLFDSTSISRKVTFITSAYAFGITSGDLNNDGKPEIVVVSNFGSSVNIARNLVGPLIGLPPVITDFNPKAGSTGTEIIITGNNFDPNPVNMSVYLGEIEVTVTSGTTNMIKFNAPAGVSNQPITVLNKNTGLQAQFQIPFLFTFAGGDLVKAVGGSAKNPLTSFATQVNLFVGQVHTASGSNNGDIAVADIDGDSFLDIIVANENLTSLSVYRNLAGANGGNVSKAMFTAPVMINLMNTYPTSIAVKDMDGDGKPDLIVGYAVSGYQSKISVFKNTATAGIIDNSSFAAPFELPLSYGVASISIKDMDKDGRPDILVGVYYNDILSVFRNISSRGNLDINSFEERVDFNSGNVYMDLGDIDQDNKEDLVLVGDNAYPYNETVFRNSSQFQYQGITLDQPAVEFPLSPTAISNPYSIGVALADIDADGKKDIISSTYNGNKIFLRKNTSTSPGTITSSTFGPHIEMPVANNQPFWNLKAGDLNGDGKSDIITSGQNVSISLFQNVANQGVIDSNSFRNPSSDYLLGPSGNPASVYKFTIADLNQDGRLDIIGILSSADSIFILQNIPIFKPPVITDISPAKGAVGQPISVIGKNFSAIASENILYFGAAKANILSSSSSLLIAEAPQGSTFGPLELLNMETELECTSMIQFTPIFNATGSLSKTTLNRLLVITTSSPPNDLALFDLNGDNKTEIVVDFGSTSTFLGILQNNSAIGSLTTQSFGSPIMLRGSSVSFDGFKILSLHDFDRDGIRDIARAQPNTVAFFKNNSNISQLSASSFNSPYIFSLSSNTADKLGAADIDLDGKSDLLAGYITGYNMFAYKNQGYPGMIGSGSFGPYTNVSGSILFIKDFNSADFNQDGWPDLIVSGYYGVSVAQNISTIAGVLSSSSYASAQPTGITNGAALVTADLNGDKKTDAAVIANNLLYIMTNQNTGGSISGASFAVNTFTSFAGNSFSIAAGDLDGDGKEDLVVGLSNGWISIIKNTSNGSTVSFADTINIKSHNTTLTGIRAVAIADMDGDGRPEIVTTNPATNSISIVVNAITQTVPVQGILVSGQGGINTVNIDNGILQMIDFIKPANADNKGVSWSITSDSAIAKISQTGLLSAFRNGLVTVIATSKANPNIFSSVVITISGQVPGFKISGIVTDDVIKSNQSDQINGVGPNPCKSDFILSVKSVTGRTYQWFYNDSLSVNDLFLGDDLFLVNDTMPTYRPVIDGYYNVVISDGDGKYYNYSQYKVDFATNEQPELTSLGTPDTALVCTTKPQADGYQWYVEDLLIAGATSPQLRIWYNGNYYVVAYYKTSGCRIRSESINPKRTDFYNILRSDLSIKDSSILNYGPPKGSDLKIYPNPANQTFTLNFNRSNIDGDYIINIYSSQGQLVKSITQNKDQSITINAKDLGKGVYIIKVDIPTPLWGKLVLY